MSRVLIQSSEVISLPVLELAHAKGDVLLDAVQRLSAEVKRAAEPLGAPGWPRVTLWVEMEAGENEEEAGDAA